MVLCLFRANDIINLVSNTLVFGRKLKLINLFHRIFVREIMEYFSDFFMSFIINGMCYHIFVHPLPLQVAAQTSLTGVVFRAVGMMYLVDLDDTPGYQLTITREGDVGRALYQRGNCQDTCFAKNLKN